jgi:hypothetical protein
MKSIISFIFFVGWIAGIVLANGFWSTTIAVIIPLWSWYLVIEQLLIKFIL